MICTQARSEQNNKLYQKWKTKKIPIQNEFTKQHTKFQILC